jgi:hypothetical protein
MSSKKLETLLSLIEVAEKNLKNAKELAMQMAAEKGIKVANPSSILTPGSASKDEGSALEVIEGYFDGENMVGDNSQIYAVPQNYASKTQLVIGDRMKWILTPEREIFKLIQPTPRKRVTGTFTIEGDNYVALVDGHKNPVKVLKASATYAMKNLGLDIGDEIAIYIPQDATPTWGAFISVVKPSDTIESEFGKISSGTEAKVESSVEELDDLGEFQISNDKPASQADYF